MISIKDKIDRLAEIKKQQDTLKTEKDTIEAELLKIADSDLKNTKLKTCTYQGSAAKLTATMSESVKITYSALLKDIFGTVYKDMVTEKTTYELTAPAKRLIAALWLGNYVKDSCIDDVLTMVSDDEKTQQILKKKCKGKKYETDRKNLVAIANTSEREAADYAYMIAEAATWQEFKSLLNARNITETAEIEQLMRYIETAFVVEETPKVKLEV